MSSGSSRQAVIDIFETFRVEIDAHNDKRERLVKLDRDITSLSKKVVFLLHRHVTTAAADKDEDVEFKKAAAEGRKKLAEIRPLFATASKEVVGQDFWRYQKQISSGLQEYIEALSFAHYLEHGTLVTSKEVEKSLSDEHGVPYFPVPMEEYLLGVSDLTGELMRFAIAAIFRRGRRKARQVSNFVRNCKADFEGFTPYVRFLSKKQNVTGHSLLKIEDAAYEIAVRTSEHGGSEEEFNEIVDSYVSHIINDPDGQYGRRHRSGKRRDDDMDLDDED